MHSSPRFRKGRLLAFAIAISAVLVGPAAANDDFLLAPQTKLRVSVVEWIEATGEYKSWDALNGEYAVGADGDLSVPLIGNVNVAGKSRSEAEAMMAATLQVSTGLRSKPSVTLGIIEYPNIYVVGDVASSGSFQYRPAISVLQALSLAGGRLRDRGDADGIGMQQIGYIGDIEAAQNKLNRLRARQARLEAEAAGAADPSAIRFPAMLGAEAPAKIIADEERAIFVARSDSLKRQLDALDDLQSLLNKEIGILDQKISAQDQQIASAREELDAVMPLVNKGIATASRRYDAERRLTDLQSSRLDIVTAAMRARQSLANASRDAVNLRGERQMEVSRELQDAQSSSEEAQLSISTKMQLLAQSGVIAKNIKDRRMQEDLPLVYTITRQIGGERVSVAADDRTLLQPGDVMQVKIDRSRLTGESSTSELLPPAAVETSEAAAKLSVTR